MLGLDVLSLKIASENMYIEIAEGNENQPVNAFELGTFLFYFRAAYVAILVGIQDEKIPLDEPIDFAAKDILAPLSNEVETLWLAQLSHDLDLEFQSLHKGSPLVLITRVNGFCLLALTTAVIISGGEVKLSTGEFSLSPLATSIRELKEAFRHEQFPGKLPSERRPPPSKN